MSKSGTHEDNIQLPEMDLVDLDFRDFETTRSQKVAPVSPFDTSTPHQAYENPIAVEGVQHLNCSTLKEGSLELADGKAAKLVNTHNPQGFSLALVESEDNTLTSDDVQGLTIDNVALTSSLRIACERLEVLASDHIAGAHHGRQLSDHSTFLGLPREVRDIIYEYYVLLDGENWARIAAPFGAYELARVHPQVRAELSALYFKEVSLNNHTWRGPFTVDVTNAKFLMVTIEPSRYDLAVWEDEISGCVQAQLAQSDGVTHIKLLFKGLCPDLHITGSCRRQDSCFSRKEEHWKCEKVHDTSRTCKPADECGKWTTGFAATKNGEGGSNGSIVEGSGTAETTAVGIEFADYLWDSKEDEESEDDEPEKAEDGSAAQYTNGSACLINPWRDR
ncbi:hypothetical protein EJ08DRAFT_658752 [Tothia fuscella]|uniref:Uncharacterized protein n=1 Tax=Tothia fuscella TaxID=1048955 RepID=A0A9P4U1B0_9PEZI|nr:hypothetical protein EJ08DRAFT_658752 [Tothia fuscella]